MRYTHISNMYKYRYTYISIYSTNIIMIYLQLAQSVAFCCTSLPFVHCETSRHLSCLVCPAKETERTTTAAERKSASSLVKHT